MKYQKIKGTNDFFNEEAIKYRYIEQVATEESKKFGFSEVITPIFEMTELFTRSVGEDSDIVNKEMYTFTDRGDRSITLRPEGTAVISRCLVENKLYANPGLLKQYYFGPMFRYERPQAGRLRQFTQFGIEAFGLENPLLDADIINLAWIILKKLGLSKIKVLLNTIGSNDSRKAYVEALKEYFAPQINTLCGDCQRRLVQNPLRILDCKIDGKSELIKNAPTMESFLSDEDKQYFEEVQKALRAFDIDFVVDTRLVRGLDYYSQTVFEITYEDPASPINNIILGGGGRYNSLISELGGPNMPAIGFALGVERLMMVIDEVDAWPDLFDQFSVVVITLGKEAKMEGLRLTNYLRTNGIKTEIDYQSNNLKPQFKLADRVKARYLLILGEDEIKNDLITVKDNETGKQETISVSELKTLLNIEGEKTYAYQK
ncbi:MAG: histidine--tRNA ligase [Bacilli bacterium]|jgi:histidyl-tRNA synthetase|nr:histidine--tRNA ligase [Acholeplasmataceae bacterium]